MRSARAKATEWLTALRGMAGRPLQCDFHRLAPIQSASPIPINRSITVLAPNDGVVSVALDKHDPTSPRAEQGLTSFARTTRKQDASANGVNIRGNSYGSMAKSETRQTYDHTTHQLLDY